MPSHTPAEASPYSRHLPALDGIRGLAALSVVASHVFPGTSHNTFESLVRSLLSFGANGVDLFFALSGFLITGILFDSLAEPRYFRKFYARRALRIFPLYYGVLLFFLVAGRFHSNDGHQLFSAALYLHNTWLLSPPIWVESGRFPLPLSHFWSLAVEEQFYLMWPLAVFFIRRRKPLLIVCAASLILCPLLRAAFAHHGVRDASIHANVFARADTLLAGAALALLLRGSLHDAILRHAPPVLAIATAIACIVLWQNASASDHLLKPLLPFGFEYTALAVASCGLIASALGTPAVGHPFHWQWLRTIGKYSYGLYVYHLILFSYLAEPLRRSLESVSPSKPFVVLASGLLMVLISFAVAWLSYELYERRFLRLKRFFDYRPHPDTVYPPA